MPSSNPCAGILTPKMIVLEIKLFGGGDEVLGGGVPRDETSVRTEGTPESALLTSIPQEHHEDRKYKQQQRNHLS